VLTGIGALAPLPGGGFLAGERATGIVHEVTAAGTVRAEGNVTVAVSPPASVVDERGLTGLAVDGTGRVFAAWVGAGGNGPESNRLVVGQIFPEVRLVWVGPAAVDHDLGGAIALAPDGHIVVAVGDFGTPEKVADPVSALGKLLSLDPNGATNQSPEVLSSGWNDPTALAYGPDGRLWVVDRSASGGRVARGDKGGRPTLVVSLRGSAVRSATTLSARELVVCTGTGDGRMERRTVGPDGPVSAAGALVSGCSTAMTRLVDGRIATATAAGVQIVAVP